MWWTVFQNWHHSNFKVTAFYEISDENNNGSADDDPFQILAYPSLFVHILLAFPNN